MWTSPRRNKNEMAKNARAAETPPSDSQRTTRRGSPLARAKTSKVRGGGKRSSDDEDNEDEFCLTGNIRQTTKRMKMTDRTAAAYKHSDEDEESEDDDSETMITTTKAIWNMDRRELMDFISEQNKMIRDMKLKLELAKKHETGRRSLKLARMDHDWNATETLFADVVTQHVKYYLFPRYKFLKQGWDEYQPDQEGSLSRLVEEGLSDRQPLSDKKEMWERVTAVSIKLKYGTLKCNINNAIKAAYKSELSVVAIDLCVVGKLYLVHCIGVVQSQVIQTGNVCFLMNYRRGLRSLLIAGAYTVYLSSFATMFDDSIRMLG